jgi:hypothetical protein
MVLKAYWPLNETSGTIVKDVRGNNDGTVNGATMGASGVLGTTAYSFNGAGDHIDVPADSSFNTLSEATFSAWVDTTGTSDQHIISCGSWEPAYYVYIASDGSVYLQWGSTDASGGSLIYSSTKTVNDGVWHHIVVSYDTSSGKSSIHIDGVEDATSTHSQDSFSTTDPIGIGYQRAYTQNYFSGSLCDIRIYDHALTPAEVQYLYQVSQRGQIVSGKRQS